MRKICHFLILGGLSLTLVGCMGTSFAPVDEGWQKPSDVGGVYQVKQGETLQDIAWRFNLNVNRLAQLNNLTPPYSLRKGQMIYLTSQAKTQNLNPTEQSTLTEQTNSSNSLSNDSEASTSDSHLTPVPVQPDETAKNGAAGAGGVTSMVNPTQQPEQNAAASPKKSSGWQWPINGQVVSNFSGSSKGMEIKGQAGQQVLASRGGQVVYSGDGLPGYGNLVIIKHPDGLMSVYAQNRKLLVKEGENVQAGQAVAEVGDSNKLHFEIRKNGKPVDPSTYLGN